MLRPPPRLQVRETECACKRLPTYPPTQTQAWRAYGWPGWEQIVMCGVKHVPQVRA